MTVEYVNDGVRLDLKVDPKTVPRLPTRMIAQIVLLPPDNRERTENRYTE